MNDNTSGTTLRTPQKKEISTTNEEKRARRMEIENGEVDKNHDDDDDDIVIKKKGNPLEDSAQKESDGNGV